MVNQRITRDGVKTGPFQMKGSLIVGSMHVEALYPKLDVEVVAEEDKYGGSRVKSIHRWS